MARKQKKRVSKAAVPRTGAAEEEVPASTAGIPSRLQDFLEQTSIPEGYVRSKQFAPFARVNQP